MVVKNRQFETSSIEHKIFKRFAYHLHEEDILSQEQFNEIAKTYSIKAILYGRVSTDDQEFNKSLPSQIDESFELAKKLWNVKEEECLVITESKSGKLERREGIQYALNLFRQRIGIQYYIAYSLCRTARDSRLQGVFHKSFERNGIMYQYVTHKIINTPDGRLNTNIQGAFNEYMREVISLNTERGRIRKLLDGEHVPIGYFFGYKYNENTDMYEVNEEQAKAINLMVELLMEKDYSRKQIEKEMAKRKINAPKGYNWYSTTITRILTNDTYYSGINYYRQTKVQLDENEKKITVDQPKELWIKMKFPIIVEKYKIEDVLKKLNIIANEKKGRPSINYWSSHVTVCGRCGRRASAQRVSTLRNGDKLRYYACNGKNATGTNVETGLSNKSKCHGKNWRMDHVDKLVWGSLLKRLENFDIVIDEIINQTNQFDKKEIVLKKIAKIEKEIIDLQSKIDNLIQMFVSGNSLVIKSEEHLANLIEPNEVQKNELEKELALLNSELNISSDKDVTANNLIKYHEKYKRIIQQDSIDVQTKKVLINCFIDSVTLNEDDVIEIKFKWGENESTWHKLLERTALLEKSEGENSYEVEHRNGYVIEADRNLFYVSVIEKLENAYIKSMRQKYKWAEHLDKKDEIVKMYQQDLMTLAEIGNALNIDYWNIEGILNYLDVPKLTIKERAKKKREKHFDQIFDLHFKKNLSLNEIYSKYGFSPIYCKSVLRDKGYSHQGFKNQIDLAENKKKYQTALTEKKQIKIAERYAKGESPNLLAKEYGINRSTVTSYAKKHGFVNLKEEKRIKLEQSIIDDYVKHNMGITPIAKKYGYKSNSAIQTILKKHKIETRPSPQQYIQMLRNGEIDAPVYKKYFKMKQANMKLNIEKIKDEDLFELVITEKVPSSEIGWLFGCGRTTVYNRRERCGLIHNQTKERLQNLKSTKGK